MISGEIFIGRARQKSAEQFQAINPLTGKELPEIFFAADATHVEQACLLAEASAEAFSATTPDVRADFLDAIADELVNVSEELIARATIETGLPCARLEGECKRTVLQLRHFGALLRDGAWLDATINTALPNRAPLPRPDLRRVNVALGPVAVFGASNFPLAFSVAGGDTASALAAGCPVVFKGHPAHPGTGELVARAILRAMERCEMPNGTFSYLPGPSLALGQALVTNPHVQAAGFTGSRAGGMALMKLANERSVPIPIYAEMSAINPVILFPGALKSRAEELGRAFVASLTMGAGQFCTNPGLILAEAGPDLDRFVAAAAEALDEHPCATMLSPAIYSNYETGVAALSANSAVRLLTRGPDGAGCNQGRSALFSAKADDFVRDPALAHEVFGASALIIEAGHFSEIPSLVEHLEGQLTATLMLDTSDHILAGTLLPLLTRKAGRVLANGWPTGVEVCEAMVHGGPFPATSDGRTTSVGSLAIARFLRPVCYQDMPEGLLPDALKQANPLGIKQQINGKFSD